MKSLKELFADFFHSEKTAGLLLVCCTVVSLFLANTGAAEGYLHLVHVDVGPRALHRSVEGWINDGLMAVFFLMVGLEVERELYVGELSDRRKAVLPLAAALGGMLVPALVHFALNRGTPTQSGFAIPMATDIAFALGILSLAGKRVPVSIKVFLAALAIIDDIGAVLVIAFFYTKKLGVGYLLGALGIFGGLLLLNRLRVRFLWIYLLAGVGMWYCLLQSGVHATLAGVLLAFAIPFHERDERNISLRLQHWLHRPVAFGILPLFALANTAIVLPAEGFTALGNRNALGIMLGLFLGKVTGILLFTGLLLRLGLGRLQEGLNWGGLVAAGFLGGIGFTMSMFLANLSFDDPALVTASKLSILLASTLSALLGLLLLRLQWGRRQRIYGKIFK
ncbi:Na+/H+ antiporter NhaA [Flaviaesturariibacter aridisoli]|uniref:Na(+)/H(+) antiporter NhaA n=1 Tax=Flaviaesturariibacter aridisoli TaxID=2545761 RepID=A0A4R4DZC0_9BACT|nr:Na+/H+ antiporter NhaA [Flaviaesturariibacter aridisoli]TCZ69603.1 Na+/H+ antiporter NhaA [Flaviaesturariibacter aridisoli]